MSAPELGFQHVLVEHARNVVGIDDASHGEYEQEGTQVVSLLSCSLAESEIKVELTPGSRLAQIHGSLESNEPTNCNYGLEPAFGEIASSGGLEVCAIDDTGEVRAVERGEHPFFLATLYQPQRRSRLGAPHPIWSAFIEAVTR